MVKINVDRLMDAIIEYMDVNREYHHSSAKYRKKYHHGFYADKPDKTPEEKHLDYYYHSSSESDMALTVMMEVLMLDAEGQKRALSAAKAVNRWYNRTRWQHCLNSDTLERLERFIFQY